MIDLFRRSPELRATRHKLKKNVVLESKQGTGTNQEAGIVHWQREATLVQKIPLRSLIGSSNDIDEKNVALLAELFGQIKQTNPILVVAQPDGMFLTISGHHRACAARVLKWDLIDAIVLTACERDLELIGIAENLHRRQASVLSRALSVSRWCQLILEGAQLERPAGGRQPKDHGIAKAAMALGFSRTEVQRCVQIARLSKEAAQTAIEFGLDNHQTALRSAAQNKTISDQISTLQEYLNRKRQRRRLATSEATSIANIPPADASVSIEKLDQRALVSPDPESHLNTLIAKWESFLIAFHLAPQLTRERFARQTLPADRWFFELIPPGSKVEATSTGREP